MYDLHILWVSQIVSSLANILLAAARTRATHYTSPQFFPMLMSTAYLT